MRLTACTAAATLAAVTCLAAAPVAGAQTTQAAAAASSCSVVSLSVGAVSANVLGLVGVTTPGTSVDVTLNGLVGSLVCGLIGA